MLPPGNFLTESRLEDKLKIIFPNYEFIRDKIIPESGLRYRPDFRCEDLKLIVEFDGPQHYTSARNCLLDVQKDLLYSNLGYRVVRIPNFIQLDTKTLKVLFNKDLDMELDFPHGFISKNAIPPADYCELGIERFLKEVRKFGPKVQEDISKSLKAKVEEYGDWRAVVNSKTKWLID